MTNGERPTTGPSGAGMRVERAYFNAEGRECAEDQAATYVEAHYDANGAMVWHEEGVMEPPPAIG